TWQNIWWKRATRPRGPRGSPARAALGGTGRRAVGAKVVEGLGAVVGARRRPERRDKHENGRADNAGRNGSSRQKGCGLSAAWPLTERRPHLRRRTRYFCRCRRAANGVIVPQIGLRARPICGAGLKKCRIKARVDRS